MEEIESIEKTQAPYGKEVEFQTITYDNGFQMLRLRIREGKRFTMVDLDPNTAKDWLRIISHWAEKQPQE
ncbi:MAG: hypothetical protein R3240_00335 [Gammaproteobacteria bacterium]|nr:hypothetical protein [Gammaproteobacteria bacterium]